MSGILNGVDTEVWNPRSDPHLAAGYDEPSLEGKAACKRALQEAFGLEIAPTAPLLCIVSRLTSQKGMDLVLAALPGLLREGAQLAVQGAGEPGIEDAFRRAQAAHPGRVAVRIVYDEAQAHRLIAGADMILVSSRFEPCGLTQLYGLRYGTIPVVRRVGGLADTVADDVTGFSFGPAEPAALAEALGRACARFREPAAWLRLMREAMRQEVGWSRAAAEYRAVYEAAIESRQGRPRRAPG